MPSGAVSVAGSTRWANPFRSATRSREANAAAVAQFSEWLTGQHQLVAKARRVLPDLDLACWCVPDLDCHADVWLRVVNETPEAFPMAPLATYPRTMADLPEGRRRRLLLVDVGRDRGCDLWMGQRCTPPVRAQLADDGRFHLIGDGPMFDCASHAEPGETLHHEYTTYYWDRWRTPPRVAPPTDAERDQGVSFTRTLTWLNHTRTDTSLIPRQERCPLAAEHWPGYTGTGQRDPHAQTRRILVRQLGPMCHSCGLRRACIIDHDHDTGMIRGYVCRHCNARMDNCVHLHGCPWADYLNNPPALALKLPYRGTTKAITAISDAVIAEREAAANTALLRLATR